MSDVKGDAETLGAFYAKYPSFIWGPSLVAGGVYGICKAIPGHLAKLNATQYGLQASAMYALYGCVLSFAVHGWYCTFGEKERQLQAYEPRSAKFAGSFDDRMGYKDKPNQPRRAAIRTFATFWTSLVYTFFPFAQATTSWASFAAWTCALAVYWDLHFFCVHKFAHENGAAYKFLHKLHHQYKAPDVFSAYFVTYQSHFCTEQSVVLIMALCGLPVDVFNWTLYFGTLDSFIKHAGHSVGSTKLPFVPFTWEQLCTVLSPWGLILGGATTAEHDWHHEKFTTNYSLSFQYLDKLLGSFHPGRPAGEALKPAAEKMADSKLAAGQTAAVDEDGNPIAAGVAVAKPTAPNPQPATAQYTNLIESTAEDWVVQGKAFDTYKENGHVVANILRLVENMKGEMGEIGARVDMYEHSLQTATRARRAGADTETIVCALLHDIGEVLSGTNHGEIASALLRPYISPKNHWLLSQHEVFQAHYFLDKCGGDKDLRDKVKEYQRDGIVKGHPWYEATERFCLEYDQPSFDPSYDTDSLSSFVPLVTEVFDRKPFWWEPEDKKEEDLDCKARLAYGYSLDARADKEGKAPAQADVFANSPAKVKAV